MRRRPRLLYVMRHSVADMRNPEPPDPFAHLRRRASERANRTLERLSAAIAALRSAGRKITAESLKQVTRELEPGFAGLSFQVIRRNARAYELYREAADAFTTQPTADKKRHVRRRRRPRTRHTSYDPLQRLDKKELVRRIRALEQQVEAERQRRGALAYDQQVALSKILRLETELLLLQAERSHSD
jgi:hypothetical protein